MRRGACAEHRGVVAVPRGVCAAYRDAVADRLAFHAADGGVLAMTGGLCAA